MGLLATLIHPVIAPSFTLLLLPHSPCYCSLIHPVIAHSFTQLLLLHLPCYCSLIHPVIAHSFTLLLLLHLPCYCSLIHPVIAPILGQLHPLTLMIPFSIQPFSYHILPLTPPSKQKTCIKCYEGKILLRIIRSHVHLGLWSGSRLYS